MIYTDFEEAKKADPQKKGVGLFEVGLTGVYEMMDGPEFARWVWARSKDQAVAEVAVEREGYHVSRIHVGVDTGTFHMEDLHGK